MSQPTYQKLAGTLSNSFKVGKGGITVSQGTDDPNTAAVTGKSGDLYIQRGATVKVFEYRASWEPLGSRVSRSIVTSSSATLSNSQHYVGVSFDGAVTLTLPTGSEGKQFIIKDEGGFASETNVITIAAASGQQIEDNASITITQARGSCTLIFGTSWNVI